MPPPPVQTLCSQLLIVVFFCYHFQLRYFKANGFHVPDLSCVVEDLSSTKIQFPLAVKRGAPITSSQAKHLKAEDIWVCISYLLGRGREVSLSKKKNKQTKTK